MILNIKCKKCKSLIPEAYQFIECPQCGAYDWEDDHIGRTQFYNSKSSRKIVRQINYSPDQLKRDIKTFQVKPSHIYKTIGTDNKYQFSRWLNGEKEIPPYIQAALWMYFEIINLYDHLDEQRNDAS